jgi:hypothetical protein
LVLKISIRFINPMLQFSKHLASKGLKVTLITTPSIGKPASSINLETVFDGFKECETLEDGSPYNSGKILSSLWRVSGCVLSFTRTVGVQRSPIICLGCFIPSYRTNNSINVLGQNVEG